MITYFFAVVVVVFQRYTSVLKGLMIVLSCVSTPLVLLPVTVCLDSYWVVMD